MIQFTSYSCINAAPSAAVRKQVPLATVLQSAGLSRLRHFLRFYNGVIMHQSGGNRPNTQPVGMEVEVETLSNKVCLFVVVL